jgi:ABC-2 type transport system permease protein
MNVRRIAVLVGKEIREFRANPSVIIPVLIVVVLCTILPFVVVVVVPRATGQSIADDRSMQQVVAAATGHLPALAALDAQTAAEAFMFQQFLMLFLMAPIVGAVSLAAYAVVGEKQGRTLEPLLTTPVSTVELLVAKAVAAFLPAVAIEAAGIVVYLALIAALGSPGVLATLLTMRTVLLLGILGPFASLAALQAAIAVSSRVNDARSAQQIAVLLVLPLAGMLVGQLSGLFYISTWMLVAASGAMTAVWVVLVLLSVALFERETILTRWR